MVFSKIHSKVVMVLMALIVAIMLLPYRSEAALANAKPGRRVLGRVPVKAPRVQPPPPPPPQKPYGPNGRGSYSHPPSNYHNSPPSYP
ncbi:hypothetical protein CIPAW_15G020000 [Carya illinoinensis]|uniref:Uncharacterized protein n=1 Tax=Carya illinoinensis TaxID=32201 RepID=A0A8T1N878_CARIL|nr:hypothetical protein CIPAW_15G020000 [Carya illinoinensis]KAG6674002.1 hypothetical protein I3842_15G020400 [Carya illinoinensis]